MKNCYDVLGCSSVASYSELKKAYFCKLRTNHPDKGGSNSALFLVTKAWSILKNENTRRDYNTWLREQLLREGQGIVGQQIVIDSTVERIEEFCSCGGEFILEKTDIDRIINSAYFECSNFVVLGSSGVGKSSFVNAVCNRHDVIPSSTVGCAVSVIAHQYRAGSTDEQTELIELWDIGGSTIHQKASVIFFEGAAGAILVHDLSNKKSESNLSQWVALLRGDSSLSSIISPFTSSSGPRFLLSDIESTPMPTLIVGCKSDLAPERAKQTAYDRISLNCRRPISPGSTNRIILSKFFDTVVERKKVPMAGDKRRKTIIT
uniref:J domain-containing protein n=1 Tax=Loa loa TaxID=7209 RepID=A0A1I7V7E8_LOALO